MGELEKHNGGSKLVRAPAIDALFAINWRALPSGACEHAALTASFRDLTRSTKELHSSYFVLDVLKVGPILAACAMLC